MPRILPPGEYAALAAACLAHPNDETPRLVLADLLDENDDPRGPLLRVAARMMRFDPTNRLPAVGDKEGRRRAMAAACPKIENYDAWLSNGRHRRPAWTQDDLRQWAESIILPPGNPLVREYHALHREPGTEFYQLRRRLSFCRILSVVYCRTWVHDPANKLDVPGRCARAELYACRLVVPEWDRGEANHNFRLETTGAWDRAQLTPGEWGQALRNFYGQIALRGCLYGRWGGPTLVATAAYHNYRPAELVGPGVSAQPTLRFLHQVEQAKEFAAALLESGYSPRALAAAEDAAKAEVRTR